MKKTYIEEAFERACSNNATVLPLDNSCDAVVVSGPLRLAEGNPAQMVGLAVTALQGYSTKAILQAGIGAPADQTITHAAGSKAVAVLVTIAGAPNVFRRAPVLITLAGTGISSVKVAVYPRTTRCQLLMICVTDNGGSGQIAAATAPSLGWLTADHPGAVANEYALSAEIVNMRDFTSRNQ